ncbi:MAG: dihydroorotase [Chloroflexota bacterium]
MSERILIRGGRVIDVGAGIDERLDVLIAEGVVARMGAGLAAEGAHIVDAGGCIVSPGFIDLHAHLREPGFEQKGTIATETLAALRGGFATVCAMPNTNPPSDSASVVEALIERIARDAHVRVLPIGCTTRGRAGAEVAELAELAAAGCIAFSDDGNPVANGTIFRNALMLAGALGLPISEHADDPGLSGGGVMNEGRVSERLGLAGQPAASEIAAIARDLALCEATGGRLHIAHVSTARGIELVAEAKARGLPVTCEVTPSHLYLTEEAVFGDGREPAYDSAAKINPPLRTESDRRALVAAVNAGLVDAIATDHAPHAVEDKLCEFDAAAFGISCFETALGSLFALVERGDLETEAVLRALTLGPASAFGIGARVPGAGSLAEGKASDLVVFDPACRWTVDSTRFASRGRNTPLQGRELAGVVRAVVVAGRLALAEEHTRA